jgi:hypothetical protein
MLLKNFELTRKSELQGKVARNPRKEPIEGSELQAVHRANDRAQHRQKICRFQRRRFDLGGELLRVRGFTRSASELL